MYRTREAPRREWHCIPDLFQINYFLCPMATSAYMCRFFPSDGRLRHVTTSGKNHTHTKKKRGIGACIIQRAGTTVKTISPRTCAKRSAWANNIQRRSTSDGSVEADLQQHKIRRGDRISEQLLCSCDHGPAMYYRKYQQRMANDTGITATSEKTKQNVLQYGSAHYPVCAQPAH